MVEAEVPARRDVERSATAGGTATPQSTTTAEPDEHVLALDAPVGGEGPFNAAADRSGGGGPGPLSGEDPVAAADRHVAAVVRNRGTHRQEGGAALRIDEDAVEAEDAVEGVADPAGGHGVPVADASVAVDVGPVAAEGRNGQCRVDQGIEGGAFELHVPSFA